MIRSLYEEHGHALLAYATRITGDRAAAEDVLQETLLRAWRNAESLASGEGSMRSWLFTVARNIMTDRFRAGRARPAEAPETETVTPVEADHAQNVVDSMLAYQALQTLSDDHRTVLVELYLRGRSVTETAEALGIPPGTVKSRSHHALRKLRDRFGPGPAALEGAA
ncbi:sigma-70 family RNA polymerase sigma factor [Actinorhabdospora filicis]|uniref:sigma-70 family RNA polymerase sigma factor n=1 Tax=Actinorhabdospora filicis TaxID=1785913 RepID=UPI0032DB4AA9